MVWYNNIKFEIEMNTPKKLQILPSEFYSQYEYLISSGVFKAISTMAEKASFSKEDFKYYIQSSAAYSSNIEGNSIDIDTYLKNKKFKVKQKPKEMAEIGDLIEAYNYAIKTKLTNTSFLQAHSLLSKTILSLKSQRGKLRNQQVGIFSGGKVEYMAVEPEFVKAEFNKLFNDINLLLSTELTIKEVFYYASLIHLIFEKIHPFMDGNGRAGRLLEKWFLSEKLNKNVWAIPSEKYYATHKMAYYQNIHIGYNYYELHFERCINFLLMLPKSIDNK